jgi:hypothetical protein
MAGLSTSFTIFSGNGSPAASHRKYGQIRARCPRLNHKVRPAKATLANPRKTFFKPIQQVGHAFFPRCGMGGANRAYLGGPRRLNRRGFNDEDRVRFWKTRWRVWTFWQGHRVGHG